MNSENIVKIGHSFIGDIKVFKNTFNANVPELHSLVDISHQHHKKSLASITEKIFLKKMCKFEQTSNWARRPLRKTQLHYGSLDAIVCYHLYLKNSVIDEHEHVNESMK